MIEYRALHEQSVELRNSKQVDTEFGQFELHTFLDLIDDSMQERLLKGRAAFADELPAELANVVEFFDPEKYNAASTV